jgi:ABC-type nickel/cobalt efflux system permease component RcnA
MVTAASVGFIHTVFGPDHYIPFIVLSKARGWSLRKTAFITSLCGIGHVGSSVVIGMIGFGLGIAVNKLTGIESARGNIAAWLMIAFGFLYLIWGIRHSLKSREHSHLHHHPDGTVHYHQHAHFEVHSHIHNKQSYKELTPWILFTIFVFGPCEPFIPIVLYPAVMHHFTVLIPVTLTFMITTIGTMVAVVTLSLYGFRFLPKSGIERYLHPIAGATILLCGLAIKFIGL